MTVAEHFGFIVGIDTHAKTHTLAIINTASGGEVANETFPATTTGGNRALSWILRHTETSVENVLLSMERNRLVWGETQATGHRRRFPCHRSASPQPATGQIPG